MIVWNGDVIEAPFIHYPTILHQNCVLVLDMGRDSGGRRGWDGTAVRVYRDPWIWLYFVRLFAVVDVATSPIAQAVHELRWQESLLVSRDLDLIET